MAVTWSERKALSGDVAPTVACGFQDMNNGLCLSAAQEYEPTQDHKTHKWLKGTLVLIRQHKTCARFQSKLLFQERITDKTLINDDI